MCDHCPDQPPKIIGFRHIVVHVTFAHPRLRLSALLSQHSDNAQFPRFGCVNVARWGKLVFLRRNHRILPVSDRWTLANPVRKVKFKLGTLKRRRFTSELMLCSRTNPTRARLTHIAPLCGKPMDYADCGRMTGKQEVTKKPPS
jgi:hypothetical protein